jgi:hypothetical protein
MPYVSVLGQALLKKYLLWLILLQVFALTG